MCLFKGERALRLLFGDQTHVLQQAQLLHNRKQPAPNEAAMQGVQCDRAGHADDRLRAGQSRLVSSRSHN